VGAAHRTPRFAWPTPWAVAEVFAGVGSVARAFADDGGFQVAYLNDIDPVARATYRANATPETVYDLCDVQAVTGRVIRDAADGRPLAGLLGCPPCQGWSAAGRRDASDRRNRLLKDFFRLVNSVRPVFFAMENVPSVADRAELASAIGTLGGRYRVWQGVLNAASYGLPQSRQRVLVFGYRRDTGVMPTCPPPTHAGHRRIWDYRTERFVAPSPDTLDALLGAAPRLGAARAAQYSMRDHYLQEFASLAHLVTVGEAIGDLEDPDVGGLRSRYARALRAGRHELANHEPWQHGEDLVDRMRQVREGCRPPVEATNGRRYYSQAYARLHRRGLARTITTNFHNPGSGRFLHYRVHRTLTVREAARLQGFRDDFVFIGHPGWQERLVGNAFPPLWAEVIARHVAAELRHVLAA
jgi:DNA (cytosine-5)-methyltransferase 1